MVTVTFIRHGQSRDNVKSIWAGWKDAPLSELGEKQARALGLAFKQNTPIDIVYASPLLRAFATGQAVRNSQLVGDTHPPIILNPNLREQHFGIAEGHAWVLTPPKISKIEELYDLGIFPVLAGRDERFPEGESLNDLARRAETAIAECVLPHVLNAEQSHFHIAIASHGLCISELVAALVRLDPASTSTRSFAGLLNTAWTRVEVSIKNPAVDSSVNPPPLTVVITHINNTDHYANMNASDLTPEILEEQAAEARAFFAGKSAK